MKNLKSARRKVFLILLVSLSLMLDADAALGCPTCKDGLHANQTSLGFAISILFMMSMPFLILATWLTILFKPEFRFRRETLPKTDPSRFPSEYS